MNKYSLIKSMILILSCFSFLFADYWAHVRIERISIRGNFNPKYDIQIKARFIDYPEDYRRSGHNIGNSCYMTIRHAKFGHEGLNNVLSLLITALNNNDLLKIRYLDPISNEDQLGNGGDITEIRIRR